VIVQVHTDRRAWTSMIGLCHLVSGKSVASDLYGASRTIAEDRRGPCSPLVGDRFGLACEDCFNHGGFRHEAILSWCCEHVDSARCGTCAARPHWHHYSKRPKWWYQHFPECHHSRRPMANVELADASQEPSLIRPPPAPRDSRPERDSQNGCA
jgi:hypothetical protein